MLQTWDHATHPLPLAPDDKAPWILKAANGATVATFIAWSDRHGCMQQDELHCAEVAKAINEANTAPITAAVPDSFDDQKYNANDLRVIQHLVVMWADSVIPKRTPSMAFLKLFSEIGELIDNPSGAGEYADIFILLTDLAHMHGIHDIGAAIKAKMKINAHRTWATGPLATIYHVDTPGVPNG